VPRVLVSHPHAAAVSVGLAEELAALGKLAGYVTGVAAREQSARGRAAAQLARWWPVVANRILHGIPDHSLTSLFAVEMAARLVGHAIPRSRVRLKPYDLMFAAHDAALAVLPWPRDVSAVYAYEDGALHTFQRAARRGIARIWDLPLPHYQTIEAVLREEARRWPDAVLGPVPVEPLWKQRRKDAELALASTVSVASAFTRQSLERLALDLPVIVTPYGFPTDAFSPKIAAPAGPFTVLSVGTHDLRKGTPYLLEAWRRAAIPDAELHLVGPLRLAKSFVDRYAGTFRHRPHAPKAELGAHYAAADLLAFPTLGDGFGLVIQEAMSCATPVVTTGCGGGPECITDGTDGWLVPPRDVDALVDVLRGCAANRDRTAAIGRAARARAERWSWKNFGEALAGALAG
jgi:glycosyltransferase involved in cell wall biosynthesis